MEIQSDGNSDMAAIKDMRQQLESRIDTAHNAQLDLIASLQTLVPDLVSSLDVSLKVVSSFNNRPFTPLPNPNPNPNPIFKLKRPLPPPETTTPEIPKLPSKNHKPKPSPEISTEKFTIDESGSPLSVVRSMVAVCLLERVPFTGIDSSTVLRKLENDTMATAGEKAALREVGGESGAILAVEMALRSMAEDSGGVELEEFVVSGKSRVMVVGIDRSKLVKELPESKQQQQSETSSWNDGMNQIQQGSGGGGGGSEVNGGGFRMGGLMPRPMPDMWMGPQDPFMFPGPRGGGPRGMGPGMMVMPRGMGVNPLQRPLLGPNAQMSGGSNAIALKTRTEEDDLKDLEALLNKKSYKELQKSKTGEELLDLIRRPTARENAVAAKWPLSDTIVTMAPHTSKNRGSKRTFCSRTMPPNQSPTASERAGLEIQINFCAHYHASFKTKGGSQLKEYCTALTKEDCRRQSGSFIACEKVGEEYYVVHFRRIIAHHTDVNLGDCSFLDTCRHMKTCKYVHYELDNTQDVTPNMMSAAALPPPKPLKQRAEYCSEVELGTPQWINCDIRNFRMDILGQFGVIMADPPWDIHMELPYGTMADDEMRTLNVPALQTDGLIFLWVTGRAMELGRECRHEAGYRTNLELWGYKRVEELIWVKTNQLQRIIRTGRTGHWLNHSKEHCLVGIKGNPEVNRNIDTDVVVAEVRETSRKPDEMYPMLERISPRTRKLELFARMHNTHAGAGFILLCSWILSLLVSTFAII
ncbi:hypothetical protein RHSIM_RhsimUnG0077100 [Rhododendron simsii]|uniref:N6-adenosine-methyltransferase MT-A70-like n=1 Tax=Rhododendron simsii TaxID=118357 RepID=A0A834FW64_RHOSS|nr:hypothetical protein RHSIM_RhsimUnG0077100 [Rhododendron simsii]